MAASTTDKLLYVGDPGTATSLGGSGYTVGNTTITVGGTANWPTATAVIFAMDESETVNGKEVQKAGTYNEYKGIVASGTSIGNITWKRGVGNRNYSPTASTRVYIPISAERENSLVDWGLAQHKQDGSHGAVTADSVTTTGNVTIGGTLTIGNSSVTDGWTPLGVVPTLQSSDGQRQFVLKYTGVDYTDRLNEGMKLKVPRTSTVPTQSMSFIASSNQYASKTSPTGITFTTSFTCEALVYLNSYKSGSNSTIISRFDGSNGWSLRTMPSGQIELVYGSASSYTSFNSYQILPLKQWVRVAGVVTSTSSKTGALYINDVAVPTYNQNFSATALSQGTGSLQVGGANSTENFDGYLSEVRVWSTARTAQQIRDNAYISLVGNESGIVALYQGNGNFNDKTSNANNLTPSGGAIAIYAGNPLNTNEFAIITKIVKSGSDTLVTVFSPAGTGIPNETLGTSSYSSMRAPYGFPSSKSSWQLSFVNTTNTAVVGAVANTVYGGDRHSLTIPVGEWDIYWRAIGMIYRSGSTSGTARYGLSTAQSVFSSNWNLVTAQYHASNVGSIYQQTVIGGRDSMKTSAPTDVYLNFYVDQAGDIGFRGDNGSTMIVADCAYL